MTGSLWLDLVIGLALWFLGGLLIGTALGRMARTEPR